MKLMLVDDHLLFLEGLQYLLRTQGIEVVGTANDGKEALLKARILKPNIILMDIKMPYCNGLDALRLIKAEMPDIHIVMLTISENEEDIINAAKYGASGYLLKNTKSKELVEILSDVMNGEVFFSPKLSSSILNDFRSCGSVRQNPCLKAPTLAYRENLTGRQLEILELVAKGTTYKMVGKTLGITERTVKYHMERIIEFLHLENRAQVIAYAARMGLVEGEHED